MDATHTAVIHQEDDMSLELLGLALLVGLAAYWPVWHQKDLHGFRAMYCR